MFQLNSSIDNDCYDYINNGNDPFLMNGFSIFNNPSYLNNFSCSIDNKNSEVIFEERQRLINIEATTNFKTQENKNKCENLKNQEENKEFPKPDQYKIEDILKILQKSKHKKKFEKCIENLNDIDNKKDIEFTKKKRKRNLSNDKNGDNKQNQQNELIKNKKIEEEQIKKLRGRKINQTGNHGKMSPDNIMKRIKTIIFGDFILFLNKLISKIRKPDLKGNKENNKLLNLDYKICNRLKREEDLKILDSRLKDLASKSISPKFRSKKPDFNKNSIEKLLKNETNKTILFAFNMTLRDWMDIFCFKKSVNQIINKYNYSESGIDCKLIEESFDDEIYSRLLNAITKDDNKEYLSSFISYLYNYELWFFIKIGRIKNEK